MRRTHAPEINGEAIADDLPLMQVNHLAPTCSGEEALEYGKRTVEPRYNNVLRTKNGKIAYHRGKFRVCQLVTT